MALIEYLETDRWQEALRRSFVGAIDLLQTDRFRVTSSAIDDIRSWLTNGGVSRVQLQLDRQMAACRWATARQQETRDFLGELVQEHRHSLIGLMADGIIPWQQADFLMTCGLAESEFAAMWQPIAAGANPFETWMLTQGYSQDTIAQVYQMLDRGLATAGLRLPQPPTDPNRN